MHGWGDDFQYFAEVDQAAYEIGEICRRYGRIQVRQTKEKFGTARVYCSFGAYMLHSLAYPGYHYSQFPKWLWKLDCLYVSRVFGRVINPVLIPFQKLVYRAAYKRVIAKYPFIREEILAGADYREFLKGL